MVHLLIDDILDLMKYNIWIVDSGNIAVIGTDKVTRIWPLEKV